MDAQCDRCEREAKELYECGECGLFFCDECYDHAAQRCCECVTADSIAHGGDPSEKRG